jgi:hypothetical protein
MDSMFTEFARRAAINMGQYLETAERYGRLAMKAQGNCRATLETLAKLHQPREQTVQHVRAASPGPRRERRANGVAGCTAGRIRARLRATTMPTSMEGDLPPQWPSLDT